MPGLFQLTYWPPVSFTLVQMFRVCFIWLNSIPWFIHVVHVFFLYSLCEGHWHSFHSLATVSSTTKKTMGIQRSPHYSDVISSGYIMNTTYVFSCTYTYICVHVMWLLGHTRFPLTSLTHVPINIMCEGSLFHRFPAAAAVFLRTAIVTRVRW